MTGKQSDRKQQCRNVQGPTGEAMQILSGKWKLQIVRFLLGNGRSRFTKLQRGIDGISPRVLSKELQDLQQSDIVARIVVDARLIAVDYELTEMGETLESVIESMEDWAANYQNHLSRKIS